MASFTPDLCAFSGTSAPVSTWQSAANRLVREPDVNLCRLRQTACFLNYRIRHPQMQTSFRRQATHNYVGILSTEKIEASLDYAAHLLRRQLAAGTGKLSREARFEMRQVIRRISDLVPPSPQMGEIFDHIMIALEREDLRAAYDGLHQLRGVIHSYRTVVPDQRVKELEAEVQKLREQLREETPEEEEEEVESEQEDAVKRYNKSKNRVFVIMPFSPDFDDVWNGGIKRACEENGFAALRVDQVSLSSWITDDVKEFVKMSTTVIADVTRNNPNVMFELGYALGRGKDPIIVCQPPSEKIPFDISGIRHLEYQDSWQGIEQLSKNLKKFLLSTQEKQKKRKQPRKKPREATVQKNNTAKK